MKQKGKNRNLLTDSRKGEEKWDKAMAIKWVLRL
jgi:hypothetical protein